MWALFSVLADLLLPCLSLTSSSELHTGRGHFLFTNVALVPGTRLPNKCMDNRPRVEERFESRPLRVHQPSFRQQMPP